MRHYLLTLSCAPLHAVPLFSFHNVLAVRTLHSRVSGHVAFLGPATEP